MGGFQAMMAATRIVPKAVEAFRTGDGIGSPAPPHRIDATAPGDRHLPCCSSAAGPRLSVQSAKRGRRSGADGKLPRPPAGVPSPGNGRHETLWGCSQARASVSRLGVRVCDLGGLNGVRGGQTGCVVTQPVLTVSDFFHGVTQRVPGHGVMLLDCC